MFPKSTGTFGLQGQPPPVSGDYVVDRAILVPSAHSGKRQLTDVAVVEK